jgi:hypothetical protein
MDHRQWEEALCEGHRGLRLHRCLVQREGSGAVTLSVSLASKAALLCFSWAASHAHCCHPALVSSELGTDGIFSLERSVMARPGGLELGPG